MRNQTSVFDKVAYSLHRFLMKVCVLKLASTWWAYWKKANPPDKV